MTKEEIALVNGERPIIHFLNIPTKSSIDTKYVSMSITLVHEIAHVLGMPEMYLLEEHPANIQPSCVMEKLQVENCSSYYSDVLDGDAKPFCEICKIKMFEKDIIINGQ